MQAEIVALSRQIDQLEGEIGVVRAAMRKLDADPLAYSENEFVQKVDALLEQEHRLDDALSRLKDRQQDLESVRFTHLFSVRAGGFTAYFGNTRTDLL